MENYGLILPSNTQKLTGQKTLAQQIASSKKDDDKIQDNTNIQPENNNLSSISCCSLCSICSIVLIYFIFKGMGIRT